MHTIKQAAMLRQHLAERRQGTIALVPTMGNLHAGHLALVQRAQQCADTVVVSIFVNPMQFAANEDLAHYPRTLAADQQALAAAGVDYLFTPEEAEVYPTNLAEHTQVSVPQLSAWYCGASRPGHFAGVTTVVAKLFNIVQPHIAVFGQKDYQQLTIIRHMTTDLAFPIAIAGVETVRAPDGLALSSRNQYLTPAERALAPLLYQQLQQAGARLCQEGSTIAPLLAQEMTSGLDRAGFQTDYVEVVDAHNLAPLLPHSKQAVILVAAQLGKARLLDNQLVNLQG